MYMPLKRRAQDTAGNDATYTVQGVPLACSRDFVAGEKKQDVSGGGLSFRASSNSPIIVASISGRGQAAELCLETVAMLCATTAGEQAS